MPRTGSAPDPLRAREERRLARKAERQAARRKHILQAAEGLLAEQGLAALTITAVAAAAGVSKPAVYYYFRSREEVLGCLAVEIITAEVAAIEATMARAPSGLEAAVALLRTRIDRYAADLDAFRIAYVFPQLLELPRELLEAHIYPLAARVNEALAARLEADRLAGTLATDLDPRRLANLAWTSAHGILALAASMQAAGGTTRATVAQLRDEACALLRHAAR